jgi:anaerobic ribonucleoside-triphosphate reductase
MSDDAVCIVCGSSQHGNWECKPKQAPREQKIQWFKRAWFLINLPSIAVLSRGLSHGLVTEIERLREIAKQNIDAKYEIGRMLGCPEHEELLPWIVRYGDEHRHLYTEIERLRKENFAALARIEEMEAEGGKEPNS